MIGLAIEILKRYLPQIIGALFIIALYFYWHNQVYDNGYQAAVNRYEKRDADTQRKSEELVRQKQLEHDINLQHQRENYIGAIENYAKHIDELNNTIADDHGRRLYISTKATNCNSDTMRTKAGSTEADHGRGEAVYKAELEPEITRTIRANAAEVERGKLACAELLKIVESEMVIR